MYIVCIWIGFLCTQKLGFPTHAGNVPYFQDAFTALRSDSNKRHYKNQRDKVQLIMRKKEALFFICRKMFWF